MTNEWMSLIRLSSLIPLSVVVTRLSRLVAFAASVMSRLAVSPFLPCVLIIIPNTLTFPIEKPHIRDLTGAIYTILDRGDIDTGGYGYEEAYGGSLHIGNSYGVTETVAFQFFKAFIYISIKHTCRAKK